MARSAAGVEPSWPLANDEVVHFPNGDVYVGGLKNGRGHGKGICRYGNGSVYEGQWVEGKPHGRGTEAWADGDFFEGGWKDGKKHGRGVARFANGGIYDGEWEDGKQHGFGTYTSPTGDVYTGQNKEGRPHGKGKLTRKDGDVYEGQWVEGGLHGWGTKTLANGDVYEGGWKNGLEHGRGTLTLAAGDVYEGRWIDGHETQGKVTCGEEEGANPEAWRENRDPSASRDDQSGKEKRVYDHERTLRSTTSQQRRLQRNVAAKQCEHCGVDDGQYKLRTCSGCNLALYCSAACQKAARGSHQRICGIISKLPPSDADRLVLEYCRKTMVDLDAGLRYGTKYMDDNLKHLEIDIRNLGGEDTVKLSAKQLSSLLRSKKGTLESVFWTCESEGFLFMRDICESNSLWKELHGLKQLRLLFMSFSNDADLIHDIIYQQRNTLMVLCLPCLNVDWRKAKSRRSLALAVNSCKHLVKLNLERSLLMDSDLKVMLHDLPDLRVLSFTKRSGDSHEFTDNTCGLIARKCPGLQELNLYYHNQLSVKGVRKIFEGCPQLRSFYTSTLKLSCDDVRNLLDIAPQLLMFGLGRIDVSEEELSDIVESTGGRTLVQSFSFSVHKVMTLAEGLSAKSEEKYLSRMDTFRAVRNRSDDPKVVNEWEEWFEG